MKALSIGVRPVAPDAAALSHLFAAALLATAIGIGIVLAPQALVGVLSVAGLAVLVVVGGKSRVLAALVVLAAVPVLAALAGYENALPGGLNRADDLALALGFLPLAVAIGRLGGEARQLAWVTLGLLAAGEAIGMIESHGGWWLGAQAAWQDLRWLGAIGWGFYLGSRMGLQQRVSWTYYLLVAWNVSQAVVAGAQMVLGAGTGVTRFSIPVVGGLFGQPTLGAVAGTMLLLLLITDAVSPAGALSRRQRLWGLGLGLAAIVMSTRFKPLLALAGLLILYLARRLFSSAAPAAAVLAAVPLVFFVSLPAVTNFTTERQGGTGGIAVDTASHTAPRVELVKGAESLASQAFPFGWGLGTFGSGLDETLELDTFGAAGLGSRYGFSGRGPSFRHDSLVAHVLAERGWAGMATWLGALFALLLLVMRLSPRHLFPTAAFAGAIAIAPVTPSFHDGATALLIFLPAAFCFDVGGQRRHERDGD